MDGRCHLLGCVACAMLIPGQLTPCQSSGYATCHKGDLEVLLGKRVSRGRLHGDRCCRVDTRHRRFFS